MPHPEMNPNAQRAFKQTPTDLVGDGVTLRALLRDLFHCMEGPRRAYFELPVSIECDGCGQTTHGLARVVYVTLGYGKRIAGLNTDEADYAALIRPLWEAFKAAYLEACTGGETQPLLFWRTEPLFRERYNPHALEVSCRVAIPGVDLTKCVAYKAEGAVVPSAPEQQEVSGGNTTQAS